jgi:hypothetical protein
VVAALKPEEPTMRIPKLNRSQRRRLRELADTLERITQGDLNYFARFPHRKHRVREADCAEIEQAELIGVSLTLSPGNQHYRAVRYLTPHTCLGLWAGGPADIDPDSLEEETARAIFEYAAPDERLIYVQGDLTHTERIAILEALK